MHVTVTVCVDGKSEEKLAVIEFQQKEPDTDKLEIEREILLPGGKTLTLSAIAMPKGQKLSVTGFLNKEQVFLLLSPLGNANPYLGVKVPDIGYLHFYFEKQ